jgi:hypothetical protein
MKYAFVRLFPALDAAARPESGALNADVFGCSSVRPLDDAAAPRSDSQPAEAPTAG